MGNTNGSSDLIGGCVLPNRPADISTENMIDYPRPKSKRKRKPNPKRALDCPQDEAIAQYLAAPKSIREFKSLTELARQFNISRMTVYRRSRELEVLQRVQWLLCNQKMAGELVARLSWERVVKGQVKAAATGNTRAAVFCKAVAWPDDPMLELFES